MGGGINLYVMFFRSNFLPVFGFLRIGHWNWKKFFHLKGKGNLISFLLIKESLKIECSSGMAS